MAGPVLFRTFRLILYVFLHEDKVNEAKIHISQVEESQHTGKISLGLSVIVRVTLKDGTYHEVFDAGVFIFVVLVLMPARILGTVTSRIARGKLLLLRRPRRKGQQMPSSVP